MDPSWLLDIMSNTHIYHLSDQPGDLGRNGRTINGWEDCIPLGLALSYADKLARQVFLEVRYIYVYTRNNDKALGSDRPY